MCIHLNVELSSLLLLAAPEFFVITHRVVRFDAFLRLIHKRTHIDFYLSLRGSQFRLGVLMSHNRLGQVDVVLFVLA